MKNRLTEPQFRHLRMLVLAIAVTYGRKNIAALKAILPGEAHPANLSLFLRYNWEPEPLLNIVAYRQLKALGLKEGDTLYLIIDDTKVRKRGKRMQALSKVKDPATGRYFFGHTFVTAALYARGVTIPFRLKTFHSAAWCRKQRKPYRKLTDLAVACVDELAGVSPGVKVRVLFDAYYACDKMFDACDRHGFLWHTTLAANRNVFIDGTKRKVGKYARWVVSHRGKSVRLGKDHAGTHRRFRAAAFSATLKGHRPVRVVFSRRKGEKKVVALATSDLAACASRIIDHYLYRWNIEVFFKDAKQLLGLTHYQCLDVDAVNRHAHLVALAYALLTHLRLTATGEKGKRNVKRFVSRDTTRVRQVDLRNLVLEDSFAVLYGKSRHNKSLHKAVSLLLAA
jgi:hypothetical protein